MIPQKTLKDLEWHHIQNSISSLALSEPGREHCKKILPTADFFEAKILLDETEQAKKILDANEDISTNELFDPTSIIDRLKVKAPLDATQLLRLKTFLEIARRARNLIQKHQNSSPRLWEISKDLIAQRELERRIEACFTITGEVADSASLELASLREEEKNLHAQIIVVLNDILASSKYQEFLQENFFTLRNGRYVLPIKIEYKGRFEGIVHDISGSGHSIFVEPPQITDLNNRLRTAQLEIEREMRRIFFELSSAFFDLTDSLENSYKTLLELELIFARARYAIKLSATKPNLNDSGYISLERLKHPILAEQFERVVPNDVELGKKFHSLVITGPNMGGKTVLMKAVGLSALFVKSGLFVCAGENSEVAVFENVFTDIGDEQSVERGLSSFAARLLNLKSIVENANEHSLVLLDEIGEGTEPRQGEAIAQAIVNRLVKNRARTIVTTHFSELVALAMRQDGIENGAMEFDTEKLQPTFHFTLGVPGSSSALDIATKLGLEYALVEEAKRLLGEREVGLDEIMKRLEDLKSRYNRELERAQQISEETERTLKEQKEILANLKKKEKQALGKLVKELEGEVNEIRELLKEARRIVSAQSPTKSSVKSAAEKLEQASALIADKRDEAAILEFKDVEPIEDLSSLREGAKVFAASLREEGIVHRPPDEKGRVVVAIRGKNYMLDAKSLYRLTKEKSPEEAGGIIRFTPVRHSMRSQRLDLRGLTREDAAIEVDGALDRAMRDGVSEITFIHGHGTGVLKEEVRRILSESSFVKNYRVGNPHEGGDGVTVAEIDL